jgi:carbonic anhydrase
MSIQQLFQNNQEWVQQVLESDPEFFTRLTNQQTPKFLWVGCSDSRVPANQITGLAPGEVFVHRNIANLMVHTDLNALSVLQFAVDILQVEHVIICGHYGCSGVLAGLTNKRLGLVDVWLRHLKDVAYQHSNYLGTIHQNQKHDRLCELNVVEQVKNTCHTNVVQDAWARGQKLSIHGIIYGIHDGLLRDLHMHIDNEEQLQTQYSSYIDSLM